VENREEVGSFCLFQPNSFLNSVKIKTEDGFLSGVFPIELLEFFVGDWIIRGDLISREYIMYSGHCARADMTELLARCRDDQANKVINIYFKEVSKIIVQFIPFG
jgi:hypothetical protein